MTRATNAPAEARYRKVATLPGIGGQIAASHLLDFGERLVLEAVAPGVKAPGVVGAATIHVLGAAISNKLVGEAAQLSRDSTQVWRVSVSDESTQPVAEMTLTYSDVATEGNRAESAGIVEMAPLASLSPEGRRAQIARAARDVFAEKGFAAATMREVAAAARMHVPTMYRYFRSKEEILELVYDWTISQAVESVKAVLEEPGTPEEKIEPIVRQLHDVNLQLRRGTLVMNRETRSLSPQARERVLGHYATMVRRLGEVIAKGQADGTFRDMDPELAAVFIDALADVWVLRPFAVGHLDIDNYSTELVAFVRAALGRTPSNTFD